MCRAVDCQVCGKTTWAGCGQHIESVKQAATTWCDGEHSAEEARGSDSRGGFLARLFRR